MKTGQFVQEVWREKALLHINVKELEAAIHTVKSLYKPVERVLSSVDNQVSYYYLIGGGEDTPLQQIVETLPEMVFGERCKLASSMGTFKGYEGRRPQQMGHGQGVL